MLDSTWKTIFWSLWWAGAWLVVLFYFYPKFFENTDPKATFRNGPLVAAILIYLAIWLIVLIIYYNYYGVSNAEVRGLWKLKPDHSKSSEKYDEKTMLMIPASGIVDIFNEKDAKNFLSETFSFGFFISIDYSSIESIKGENLKGDYKPYQLVITLPGVYDVYVDPFHESLSIEFKSYKSANYKIVLPTLKNQKWQQIIITIEGRTADIYQNGVLLKSVSLQNVISARPGKPKINMNPEMYATVALVQGWPKRLKESEIVKNYKSYTDPQGVPPFPVLREDALFSNPFLWYRFSNFCIGPYCKDTIHTEENSLTYVNYEYA
jgi:hypothetical protein